MNKRNLLPFLLGIALTVIVGFSVKKCFDSNGSQEDNSYYILQNQISKMNKMVVVEQDFSTIQKTKLSYEVLGQKISSNEIATITKTNAQVSYDLNRMKIKVDSVNKKLIIEGLPEPDIRISPNVEILSLDDSFFNRISEEQIKSVTAKAKDHAIKKVNQQKLKEEGKKQLLVNLDQIMVLAKALNYTIEDKTNTISLLQ